MRYISLLLMIVLSGNLIAAECELSLQNGISLDSSKTEILKAFGEPHENYSDPKNENGAFNNGFSYPGISFSYIDQSLMSIYITSQSIPLKNGLKVGDSLESTMDLVNISPSEKAECWCRFGVERNAISSIELLCPL